MLLCLLRLLFELDVPQEMMVMLYYWTSAVSPVQSRLNKHQAKNFLVIKDTKYWLIYKSVKRVNVICRVWQLYTKNGKMSVQCCNNCIYMTRSALVELGRRVTYTHTTWYYVIMQEQSRLLISLLLRISDVTDQPFVLWSTEKELNTKCVVEMVKNQTILHPGGANLGKADSRYVCSFIPPCPQQQFILFLLNRYEQIFTL